MLGKANKVCFKYIYSTFLSISAQTHQSLMHNVWCKCALISIFFCHSPAVIVTHTWLAIWWIEFWTHFLPVISWPALFLWYDPKQFTGYQDSFIWIIPDRQCHYSLLFFFQKLPLFQIFVCWTILHLFCAYSVCELLFMSVERTAAAVFSELPNEWKWQIF